MTPESGTTLGELKALRRRVEKLERSDRMGASSFREPGAIRFFDGAMVGSKPMSGDPPPSSPEPEPEPPIRSSELGDREQLD